VPAEKQLIGDLNYSESIPRESLKYYKSIFKEKKDIEILKKIVYCYQRMNNENEALKWVDCGLNIKKDGDLLMIKGWLLYNKKKFQQAGDSFYHASQKLEHPGQAYLMQGFCFWYDEKINRAIDLFKKAKKYKNQKKAATNALKILNSKEYEPHITKDA
jgi:tetratricopeptide (TPR) repeat protein